MKMAIAPFFCPISMKLGMLIECDALSKSYNYNFLIALRRSPRQNFVACPSLRGINPLFAKIDRHAISCCMRLLKAHKMIYSLRAF
jgi:hypothetical protein